MSAAIDMTAATIELEPALRYLAANPDKKMDFVAGKFKVAPKDLWAWLTQFNMGRKELSALRIEAAKAAKKEAKQRAPVPAARAERMKRLVNSAPNVLPKITGPNGDLNHWLTGQGLKPLAAVTSYQVQVTPPLAQQWLSLNQGNRNPSKAKIRRFARAMTAGKWVLNGETVKFSAAGRLLDGQSRLRAIIEAAVPAVLEVRGGLPEAAQQSMDIGETRKGTHTLEMLGEKYPALVSTALRLIGRWEGGVLEGNKFKESFVLENQDIAPLLARHTGLRSSVGWVVSAGHKIKNLLPQSEAAFFHYLFGLANVKKRDAFFAALADGIGLTQTSAAYHLRERLIAERATTAKASPRERMALVIKAWNAHLAGERMTLLRYRAAGEERERFPAVAGLKGGSKS